MRFYIYCDVNGSLKSFRKDGHPETAIDFAEESLETARQLVLTITKQIENDTIYGPFEHEGYVQEKDGLY